MRKCALAGVVSALLWAVFLCPLPATTLKRLTLSDLAQQSTCIVRGRLQPSYTAPRGSVIYSHYTLQIEETWKGSVSQSLDVAVPGGVLNGSRQTYSGAPAFSVGQDYILFLWTSPGGLTQVMGLSQGLFSVSVVSGVSTVTRAATSENFLSSSGQSINDTNFSMNLSAFRASVNQILGGAGASN